MLYSTENSSTRSSHSWPRLYAIADADTLARQETSLAGFAAGLLAAGVELVQWRAKGRSPQDVLAGAAVLQEVFAGTGCRLVMNDRADLAVLAGFGGVHVGQGDLGVEDVRLVVGSHSSRWGRDEWGTDGFDETGNLCLRSETWGTQSVGDFLVGVSTHTDEQVREADAGLADYVAVGPVFATGTKADAAPVVGLDGVRRARALTSKPLVVIGGITLTNVRSVLDAGADSVAVISGLFAANRTVEEVARDFLAILR